MSTSKLQRETSTRLSVHFAKYIIMENTRPDWCLSDEYERLELDFYLPELNVAIEVQGDQHYRYTPHFHASYEDFQAQVKRDEAKLKRCVDYGITLLEVYDQVSLNDAVEKIRHISTVHEQVVREKITPRQWKVRLETINRHLVDLCKCIDELSPAELGSRIYDNRTKLLLYIEAYGTGIFDYVAPGMAQSIFRHMQKLINTMERVKIRNKKTRNKRLEAIRHGRPKSEWKHKRTPEAS